MENIGLFLSIMKIINILFFIIESIGLSLSIIKSIWLSLFIMKSPNSYKISFYIIRMVNY